MTAFSRKQEISETYAQGATTLLNRSIQGELSKTQPVELNLYFDEDILYVNTAELTFKATAKGPSHSVTNIDLVVDGKKITPTIIETTTAKHFELFTKNNRWKNRTRQSHASIFLSSATMVGCFGHLSCVYSIPIGWPVLIK